MSNQLPYQPAYSYPPSSAPLRNDSPYQYASTPPPPPPKTHTAQATSPIGSQQYVQEGQQAPHWSQQAQGQYAPELPQQPGHGAEHRVHPSEEGWLPDILLDKSKPDLQELLQNTDLLTSLLYSPKTTHPSVTASQQPLHAALSENQSLAKHLDALYSQLQHSRDQTSQRLLSVRALEQAWKKKQEELEKRLESFGPRALHSRLVASIGEQEATCQGLEESVIEGGGGEKLSEREVVEWIRRVREARKTLWLRKERRERWDEGRVGGWR